MASRFQLELKRLAALQEPSAAPAQRPPAYVLPPVGEVPSVEPIVAPFVDDSPVDRPGFFFNTELFVVFPHLNSHLQGSPNNGVDTVYLTTQGSMGACVSPRFELGYRLPEQLGEFQLAYRFQVAQRTGEPPDNVGLETDRLNMNFIDLDWCITALSPCLPVGICVSTWACALCPFISIRNELSRRRAMPRAAVGTGFEFSMGGRA